MKMRQLFLGKIIMSLLNSTTTIPVVQILVIYLNLVGCFPINMLIKKAECLIFLINTDLQ